MLRQWVVHLRARISLVPFRCRRRGWKRPGHYDSMTSAATSVATSPDGHVATGAPDTVAPRNTWRPFTVPKGAPDTAAPLNTRPHTTVTTGAPLGALPRSRRSPTTVNRGAPDIAEPAKIRASTRVHNGAPEIAAPGKARWVSGMSMRPSAHAWQRSRAQVRGRWHRCSARAGPKWATVRCSVR